MSDRADELLEGPVDEREGREAIDALGIDVAALASRLRAQVDEQDRRDRAERLAQIDGEVRALQQALEALAHSIGIDVSPAVLPEIERRMSRLQVELPLERAAEGES